MLASYIALLLDVENEKVRDASTPKPLSFSSRTRAPLLLVLEDLSTKMVQMALGSKNVRVIS